MGQGGENLVNKNFRVVVINVDVVKAGWLLQGWLSVSKYIFPIFGTVVFFFVCFFLVPMYV